jgi:hypothetical protein
MDIRRLAVTLWPFSLRTRTTSPNQGRHAAYRQSFYRGEGNICVSDCYFLAEKGTAVLRREVLPVGGKDDG